MPTIYGPWYTDSYKSVRAFLYYAESEFPKSKSITYSCGVEAYGKSTSTALTISVSASNATSISKSVTVHPSLGSASTPYRTTAYSNKTLEWNKGKASQTKTLTVKIISSSYAITKNINVRALPNWPVTYNANGGSGAPATLTKWYDEQLKLSSVKPTKSGYTFRGWATSQANASNGSPSNAYGPGAIIAADTDGPFPQLWAVWELNYSKPIISNFDVKRCLSNGKIDDEGTYAIATFDWSVFNSSLARYYGGSNAPYNDNSADTFTVTIGDKTYTGSLSGTSGPATTNIMGTDIEGGAFSMNTTYPATASLTDTQTTQSAHTGTASDTLPSTHFPLDFNADATAMGIFCPASDDIPGVHVGSMLYGNVPFARFNGKTEVTTYTTIGGFKGFNVFSGTGYSYSHLINDQKTFATDNNGVKILRDGYYLLKCETHFNTQNTEQALAIRIFNYTKNSQIGMDYYVWWHPAWAHVSCSVIGAVNKGDIVLPTFSHHQGSGWMRPSIVEFTVIYLGDLVI